MTTRPAIHLLAAASTCRPLLECLGVGTYRRIVELAQSAVGDAWEVAGDTALMHARVNVHRGGRRDDAERCRDLERALGDDRTRAIVALQGGAWFTRLIPGIDFDVLSRRRAPLHVFGFSELTTLVNIVAAYPAVRAWYHHDAGFLRPGDEGYRAAFAAFLRDVVGIAEGRGGGHPLTGRLVRGTLERSQTAVVVGGCLQVLLTLLGSRYAPCISPAGRWLALEEVYDDVYSIDRHLGHLKLAGAFEKCEGLLLGDFHTDDTAEHRDDLTGAVLELLRFHLPANRDVPVVAHCNFGHCHPAGTLPLNRPVTLSVTGRRSRPTVTIAG